MYFWPRNSMVLPKMLYEKYFWVNSKKNIENAKKIHNFLQCLLNAASMKAPKKFHHSIDNILHYPMAYIVSCISKYKG